MMYFLLPGKIFRESLKLILLNTPYSSQVKAFLIRSRLFGTAVIGSSFPSNSIDM
jgi:hypothetical protein